MGKYSDKAQILRDDKSTHYNCAQSVLMPFCNDAGIDEKHGFCIASNFGAGMKIGSICGAVTGALMALGLFGVDDADTVKDFYCRAREKMGENLDCSELLRINAQNGGNKKEHCDEMVRICADITEEILLEKGKIQ